MNRTLKWILGLILVISLFGLSGCAPENTLNIGDTFTVTFVDYDDTILKTVSCEVGVPCDITPPSEPDNKTNAYFTRWSVFESKYSTLQSNTEIKAVYTLDNVALKLFGRSVVFYSVFIMMGIAVGLTLGLREGKRVGIKPDDLIDGFLWIVPVAILGARLWYVIFEWNSFAYGGIIPSFLRIIGFSSGTLNFSSYGLSGLAIHGAFVTAIICAYFFTKKKKIDIFKVIDIIAIGFIIAQAFGRWGNFFNQEAHGGLVGGMTGDAANLTLEQQFNYLRYTLHLPEFISNNMYILRGLHGVAVEPITGYYHPTFFYESSLNVLGFAIMLVLRRLKKVHFGELLSFYLIWYGAVRIFIETMRTDPLVFEFLGITLKSAIVTSVLMIIGGILLSTFIRIKRKGMTYGTVPGYFECKKKKCIAPEENV
ncbi:MAG: prolipoprotein diacylglyceryl transferase [Candidatus Izemoplasmatales bacterium]|jgi:phosphatidylglycerol:prolipoprotein diacylglycerol transferase|nr:prolipoprotein diacylglyceryl transferase [Candidatus Izemoplasmatales bacterium]